MKANSLKAYLHARKELEKQYKAVCAEKELLEKALNDSSTKVYTKSAIPGSVPVRTVPASPVKSNQSSLKQTVQTILKQKSLSKPDLLAAILKSGYQFSTSKPLGSLNAMLYAKNSGFKQAGGKWKIS